MVAVPTILMLGDATKEVVRYLLFVISRANVCDRSRSFGGDRCSGVNRSVRGVALQLMPDAGGYPQGPAFTWSAAQGGRRCGGACRWPLFRPITCCRLVRCVVGCWAAQGLVGKKEGGSVTTWPP